MKKNPQSPMAQATAQQPLPSSLTLFTLGISMIALVVSLTLPHISGNLRESHGSQTAGLSESFTTASAAVVAIEAQRPEGIEHGAGMIISSSGEVLTGYHVIEAAMENSMPIHVLLGNGRYATATVTLHDEASDVAVLTIDEGQVHSSLPYTPIDTIAKVAIGDRIATVGNPLGTGSTHGFGWVAGLNYPLRRKSTDTYEDHVPGGWYVTALQVDMNSSKGNSGGPVFTMDGAFVGMVVAGRVDNGTPEGFTYLVPGEVIKENIAQLRANGKVTRPFLGISARRGTYTLNGDTYIGIEVTKVLPDDIAGQAGLQAGDFLTAINGKPVSSMNHYSAYVHDLPISTTSTFEVVRDGKKETLNFDLSSAVK